MMDKISDVTRQDIIDVIRNGFVNVSVSDMISLYVDHLSVRETAAKLKVDDSTVSTHHKNARDKIRNAMEE